MLRNATISDVPVMLDIYGPYILKTAITFEYEIPSLEEFTDRFCTVAAKFPWLVWEENGVVLGYAGLLVILDEGYITNVAVHPDFRRLGIASALLEAFERFGREKELSFLTLEVRNGNAPARGLYTKHGFEDVGRRRNYYEHPREDAIIMTRYFDAGK